MHRLPTLRALAVTTSTWLAIASLTGCGHHKHRDPATADSERDEDDNFDRGVAKIKKVVPGWDNGTGVAVRFLKEATGQTLALVYVDPTPPERRTDPSGWLVQSTALVDDKPFSTITILFSRLEEGRYHGSPSKLDVVMGASVGAPVWNPKADDTTWSVNEGGSVDVEMHEVPGTDHVEGTFKAKLVANVGGSYYRITDGYFYINR